MNTAQELNNGMTMCFVGKFGSYGMLMVGIPYKILDPYLKIKTWWLPQLLPYLTSTTDFVTLLEVIAMNGGPYSSSVIANKMPLGYMSQYMMTICCFEQNLAIMSSLYPPLYPGRFCF